MLGGKLAFSGGVAFGGAALAHLHFVIAVFVVEKRKLGRIGFAASARHDGFAGPCGRTDFEGGSMEVELQSLAKIAALPGDYEVYPGHMDCTTLETERRFNPYLTALQNRGQ